MKKLLFISLFTFFTHQALSGAAAEAENGSVPSFSIRPVEGITWESEAVELAALHIPGEHIGLRYTQTFPWYNGRYGPYGYYEAKTHYPQGVHSLFCDPQIDRPPLSLKEGDYSLRLHVFTPQRQEQYEIREYRYPYAMLGDMVTRTNTRTVEASDLSSEALKAISLVHKTGSTEVEIAIPSAVCTLAIALTPESRLSFRIKESSEKSPYIQIDALVQPNSNYVEQHAAALLERTKALLGQQD